MSVDPPVAVVAAVAVVVAVVVVVPVVYAQQTSVPVPTLCSNYLLHSVT